MTKALKTENFGISNFMNVICTAVRYTFLQTLLQPYYRVIYKPEHVAVFRSSISVFLVNSFLIRRGPGPNKFTRKYRSNFF